MDAEQEQKQQQSVSEQKAIEAGEMGRTLEITPVTVTATANGDHQMEKQATDVEGSSPVKRRHATSNLEAATHLFKGSVGAGLFAMGDCFKNGGLAGATILLPIIAVMCVHCERMLIRGSVLAVERTPGATFFDYPETVEKCFEYGPRPLRRMSRIMKLIVEMFLCVTQFGFCAIYFVFITENLYQVLQQNGVDISMSMVMLITLLPAMIPSLMTNLKYISPVSAFANVALLFGLIATLSIAFSDGPMPPLGDRHLFTSGSQLSLFFGTALFSYEGIALILPLRNSMRKPENFSSRFGVLNSTMFFTTALFIFTGFVSYVRWGEDVAGSITLNLVVEDVLSQVVKVVAALGVFLGYPIQFFVMMKILWPPLKRSNSCAQKYPISMQVALRFVMVMMTFGVALVVPQLNLFISLIGALCSTCLAFVIPVLIDFVVRAQVPKGLGHWSYAKNLLILAVALLGIVTGTYQSIVEIIRQFK
ncbi:proton-coupled amino acid transporter-like protein CG1139 isoform X2 [Drosophila persimilis]|uniref:Proton-coupled amino acid transporter-like protein CG1139 isoform X1 n=3 Tax=pseudoobscura subgroup TaxID=32358 RepID=A0A0R3NZE8_DROPS|nr:proton-coupled amino acid transporter-like protein CG1139 isoform X1 [Drosophila pseudoobscura]XP_026848609.1 proton-coupled amino acid transporter-like protein CG1139 isoform X2 [Drosophila persimilis]